MKAWKFAVGLFLPLSNFAEAQSVTTAHRCLVDSLDSTQALERNRYVKACYPDLIWAHAASIRGARPASYEEAWTIVQKSIEMNGNRLLPRPNHYTPVYLNNPSVDAPLNWTAPRVGPTEAERASAAATAAYCAKPENVAPTDPVYGPIGFDYRYRCKSSCFAPEVRVFFEDSYLAMKDAYEKRPEKIKVAKESSSFDRMVFELQKVKEWTASIRSEPYVLRTFLTESGRTLRVTGNHPLVTADGYFREAKDIAAGDLLVNADGTPEEVISASDATYFGKVYNVQPEGTSAKGNVIVAEGFLSGTAFVQNEGYEFINERVFRSELPSELVR